MAKDPAFLLYSSDFLTGIMFMSDEQVGKYIKLLCAQHQKGMLAEEDMLNICKTYDKKIFEKFKKTQDGLYYNERLSVEVERRKSYSESRRNNRNSKKSKEHMSNISSTYVKHMETVTINKDINIDGITDEQMQTLWIKTFGKNPSYPEREETEKLIEKFGYEKVYATYRDAKLKNFKSLSTLINNLNENGDIKPLEKTNGTSSSKSSRGIVTKEELESSFKALYGKT